MITFFNTIKYWTQVLNINLFRSCRLRRWACFVPCQCWPTFQSSLRLHLKVKNYCDTNPSLCPILWWIASKHRFPSHYRLWGVEHARDALWCLWSRHRHWWCRGTWRSISWTWWGQFSIKYLWIISTCLFVQRRVQNCPIWLFVLTIHLCGLGQSQRVKGNGHQIIMKNILPTFNQHLQHQCSFSVMTKKLAISVLFNISINLRFRSNRWRHWRGHCCRCYSWLRRATDVKKGVQL